MILVSDVRDDAAAPADLARAGAALRAARVECAVILLDPEPAAVARAAAIGGAAVVEVPSGVVPEVTLRNVVERDAFATGPFVTTTATGAPGPLVAWRNDVREGDGAEVLLRAADGAAPLWARAFRGAGRAAAWAAAPADRATFHEAARTWALSVARPAAWREFSARREAGALVVTVPASVAEGGGLRAEIGGRAVSIREETPGRFRVEGGADAGHLTLWRGDAVVAVVALPPKGDPEYAWPGGMPPNDLAGPAATARLRWPYAAAAAAAWILAVFLGLNPKRRAGR